MWQRQLGRHNLMDETDGLWFIIVFFLLPQLVGTARTVVVSIMMFFFFHNISISYHFLAFQVPLFSRIRLRSGQ